MNKIKVIDLLNMISKGEEVPKKIKYKNYEYSYHNKEHGYCRPAYDCTYICFDTDFNIYEVLNDEVEILEEEKKIPEKIKIDNEDRIQALSTGNFVYKVSQPTKNIIYKINEIIDCLDYLKSKGDE